MEKRHVRDSLTLSYTHHKGLSERRNSVIRRARMSQTFIFATPEALARPPMGLDFAARQVEDFSTGAFLDLEAGKKRCVELLERLHLTLNTVTRQMHSPAGSGVGILLEHSPFCHHTEKEGVSVVFAGEVGLPFTKRYC